MTIALFSLAVASISQVAPEEGDKTPPPKRTAVALGDVKAVPEPR